MKGDIPRKAGNCNEGVALRWTPEGRRKRGRPKETWRRTVLKERQRQARLFTKEDYGHKSGRLNQPGQALSISLMTDLNDQFGRRLFAAILTVLLENNPAKHSLIHFMGNEASRKNKEHNWYL